MAQNNYSYILANIVRYCKDQLSRGNTRNPRCQPTCSKSQHVLNIYILHRIRAEQLLKTNQKVKVIQLHRLTLPKGVYSLRYFLSPMRIPILLMHVFIMPNTFVICSCIYGFCLRNAIRHSITNNSTKCTLLSIYAHTKLTRGWVATICITRFGIRIVDRKYLNEYTPFGSVSL